MANGPALSTARGGAKYVWNEIGDSLSLLDVVHPNQFEGQSLDPTLIEQTEVNFYRGAPPKWLNFHISEVEAKANRAPFIKRDGYDTLKDKIQKSRKLPGISIVKLFHQPGCGGTTMAMQLLWDFRKTFRCAVLTGSLSDITDVATQVVSLFTAGSRGHQNTVLLLVNDEQKLEDLQESIMKTIAEQEIVTRMPVVTLLSCVRKDVVLQNDQVVLKTELSDTEKQKFNEKMEELKKSTVKNTTSYTALASCKLTSLKPTSRKHAQCSEQSEKQNDHGRTSLLPSSPCSTLTFQVHISSNLSAWTSSNMKMTVHWMIKWSLLVTS
ncbi:sterile alpha motif domain-containing protein 9-like [Acanthochromis polyacanthus]|uniref:sterile alpha motif domain-containing protein 9-like n=1 Tax=Acanthochromis polyacanthus TaxID=80966 RepID=UPI0022340E70|nr:sterile alpha motif domain-containing protein 9-like [Acanthochromis polyacanthus]